MKSPASILASKRRSSSTCSNVRTALGSRPSWGCWSIACVYIAKLLRLLRSLVDDTSGLADERAFDRFRRAHAHRGAHADQRLDAGLQPRGDLRPVCAGLIGQQLAQHLDLVELAVARDH